MVPTPKSYISRQGSSGLCADEQRIRTESNSSTNMDLYIFHEELSFSDAPRKQTTLPYFQITVQCIPRQDSAQ